ncbi:hypothetical protein Q5P01_014977 [Channa striata]|uniref:Chemokine interleukin-8-like domain-containing protein n=1 Tax=Channa striata TaxID=64152 RepID=A0AA88MI64_CHASR|nr:hypothetical protein Q5P01_014977 [Channa striata]
MKSVIVAFLTCLLVLSSQGQIGGRSNKCKCYNYVARVNPKLIKTEPVVHPPSIFCQKTEIIITIENKEKCVNPQSPLGQLILKNKSRQTKKTAVSRLHTPGKLMRRP